MSSKTDYRTQEEIWEDAKLSFQCIAFPVGCLFLGGFLGYCQGAVDAIRHAETEAVARGVAGYDATTGEWKWTVERKVSDDEQ